MDRGAWHIIVHEVAGLDMTEWLSTHACGDWIRATEGEPEVQHETQLVVARTG